MRGSWCMAAVLAAAAWGGTAQAQSRYSEPGAYGGGFIEYLVAGGAGAPAARPARLAAPETTGAVQAGRAQRYAALPYGQAYATGADPYGQPQAAAAEPDLQPEERIARAVDPRYQRQEVEFPGTQRPGTIVVDTSNRYLYLVQPGGRAIRYGIGVGRPGFSWSGLKTVSRKAEWPDWTPPREMLARRPDLPRHMTGGPENPLGARALYLGSSLYRIHGTNEPHTIGQAVSSGCIRMMNEDVVDLYGRVQVGTRVEVI